MKHPTRILAILMASLLPGVWATGAEKGGDAAADLLGALEEASRIAATTRLNIDEMPEFTTILRGDALRDAGVKDLFDALALVPGIQTSVMQNGIKKVVMRGYDNPNSFVFDKFKLVVDDHTIETVEFQNTSYYLDFPIELIDRIEVVLGPAAALQTSGALTGVIKLYTKTKRGGKGGALFFRGGSWHEAMAGVRDAYDLGDARLALDAYYRKHDRMLDAEGYAFRDTLKGIRTPESSEWNKDTSFGAALAYGGLTLTGRVKREHRGNHFGWEEYLEPSTDTGMTARYSYLQADYDTTLSATERLHLKAAFNHFKFDASLENYDPNHAIFLPVGLLQSEQGWQAEASVTTVRFTGHTLQAGLRGTATRQNGNRFEVGPPLNHVTTLTTPGGLKRYLYSLYLVDSVDFSDSFDAHFALRYDHLSDLHEGYLSADATLRYRLSEKLQIKVGYGHAYRAPSWIERHTTAYEGLRMGNPGLKAEEADTVEASLLFAPSFVHRLKLNLYYTNVDDLIDNKEINTSLVGVEPEYANYSNRESKGFELGYRFRPSALHDLEISASYCDTEYVTEAGKAQSMPGVAHWSGHLLYLWHLDAATTFSTRVQYMGPRTAYGDLADEDLGAYTTVDVTGSHVSPCGWRLYATVKNLFDEEVRDSSYYERHDGIVRPGRNLFVAVEFPL
ncbi:TonB-dependent receptor [Hydrogenimonas sp.]